MAKTAFVSKLGDVVVGGIHEPEKNVFFRLSIITYELGAVHKDIVYMMRFPDQRKGRKANLELSLADTFTQLSLLCKELDLDEEKIRKLGWQHLQERFKDFKEDGWVPVK